MERTDRRTFLAGGLRTGAAVALSGAVAGRAADASPASASPSRRGDQDATTGAGPAPVRLLVNHVAAPVGVDPDDVHFAWQLDGSRRGAGQHGYRVVVWDAPKSGAAPDAVPSRPLWDSGLVHSSRQAFVAYAGPALAADTAYRWSVSVVDERGVTSVRAVPATFTTGLRTGDWTASWLHPGPADPGPEVYTYLRKVARPSPSPVVRATAYVAAAHKYHLWVNGTLAATGPCFSFPDQSYYQATDLTPLLRAGQDNAVGLLHHWYGPGNGRPAAEPGVLVQVTVHHADGSREVFGTDDSWRERPAEWLPAPARNNEAHDFVEIIDGRQAPLGWSEPAYDDRSWSAPTVLGPVGTAPFTGLFAQRTWIEEHPVSPVSVRTLPSGSVVVDFGKIYAARPLVTFHHGVDGRTITMHAGYLLDPDGQVSTTHGTQGTDLSFTYIQRDGTQEFDPYTFFGFRYLQIDGPGESISPDDVVARARHAAMPDVAPATFTSNVAMLDAVWELCTHSCLYASHEQFVDTPTRQKGQFTCDAANESQAIMRAYGDQNQSWQGLRDFARSQARFWPGGQVSELYPSGTVKSTIPDFSELYVEWVWRYFEHTGDTATLAALYPVVENVADYVWAAVDPATGLITNIPGGGTTYRYGIVDWPPQMRYGYDMTTVARTTVNILGANVYNRAALMAEALGDPAGAVTQRARGTALTVAVNARLRRPDGVYVDGLEADGSQSTHASQQANALALAYGIVPATARGAVGAHTASLGIALGPDHGLELVRGLHAAGLDATIVRILTDPHGPGYAHIVASGGTFTWESWTPSDLEQDSLSHGWGSGALAGMHEALLGVSQPQVTAAAGTTPGAGPASTVVTVSPPSGGLSSAAGQLPTIAGPVKLEWSRRRGRLRLTLTLPPNAAAFLALPATGPGAVTESGRPIGTAPGITAATFSGGTLTARVGAGTYRFETRTA
jgi:alpha-L-rhamnosidase